MTVKLSPGVCGIGIDSFVDFDGPETMVETSDTTPSDREPFELLYRNCDGKLEKHKAEAYGAALQIEQTLQACQTAARTQSVGQVPLAQLKPGLVLCVITTESQVGWAKVTKVGCPCGESNDRSIPTIELLITAWRLA